MFWAFLLCKEDVKILQIVMSVSFTNNEWYVLNYVAEKCICRRQNFWYDNIGHVAHRLILNLNLIKSWAIESVY